LKQAPIKVIEVLMPLKHEAFLARKLAENTNVEVKLFAMPLTLENFRDSAVAIGATQLNFMEPN
jgi:MSHA biogenesis protein MshI